MPEAIRPIKLSVDIFSNLASVIVGNLSALIVPLILAAFNDVRLAPEPENNVATTVPVNVEVYTEEVYTILNTELVMSS